MFLLNYLIFFQFSFQKLNIFVDSISKTPNFEPATIGISIRNNTSNEVLYELNSKKSVNPASTLKLISTGLAINDLGRNFRFKTYLEYDGYIQDSVLKGNIYLTGNGDPSFASDRFNNNSLEFILKNIAIKIKNLGIKKIEGRIIGDGSVFNKNSLPDSWTWGDIGNYYGASATGLNFTENELVINFNTNKNLGSLAEINSIFPKLEYLKFNNEVYINVKGSGDQSIFYNSPLSNEINLTGSIPQNNGNFKVKSSIPKPEFAIAFLIENQLKNDSILCTQKAISISELPYQTYNQRFLITEFESPPLYQMIQETNFESLNLYAEAFAKIISYHKTKDSSPNGVANYLKLAIQNKGIDINGFKPKDGSGLSPSGFITANFMTDFLQKMTFEPYFNDYIASIPTVGKNGTVKNLAKNSKAAGNIQAKSGSIDGTRAYAGYFIKNGQLHSFAFIINQFEDVKNVRQVLEKMMVLMYED